MTASSCPAELCSLHKDCGSCTTAANCGWDASNLVCVETPGNNMEDAGSCERPLPFYQSFPYSNDVEPGTGGCVFTSSNQCPKTESKLCSEYSDCRTCANGAPLARDAQRFPTHTQRGCPLAILATIPAQSSLVCAPLSARVVSMSPLMSLHITQIPLVVGLMVNASRPALKVSTKHVAARHLGLLGPTGIASRIACRSPIARSVLKIRTVVHSAAVSSPPPLPRVCLPPWPQ